jgi:capsular exopolysaccharide synthesis family protein
MSFEGPKTIPLQPVKQEEDVRLLKVIGQLLNYWWLFLISIIVALTCGAIYMRYSTPKYKILAKILVKDEKKGSSMSGMQVFSDLGLLGGQNSVDNEVELLKSRTLMENTVKILQLNVRFFEEGKIKQSEVSFQQLPFVLTLYNFNQDSLKPTTLLSFNEINSRQFRLTYNEKEKLFYYGDTINVPFGKLQFNSFKKENIKNINRSSQINIFINRVDETVEDFQRKFNVAVTNKTVSTIDLTLVDVVPRRGELLLNTLLRNYNQMNIDDKNRVADSTITFIDNRLIYVTKELGDVEKNIQQFRQRNQLTDLSEQGKILLENSSDYFKELSKTEVQISIVHSLENYLTSGQNISRTIPAGLVIQDPTFASMIEKYNTLQLEKNRQLETTTESNPVVQRLNVQILNLKDDIIANLATIKRSMEITRAQLKNRTNSFESKISQVPSKERAFLEISRQQAIKQELYLYLLKKREETAVSKASNIENARIIDSAQSERFPFSPKRTTIFIWALLLGLVIPAFILSAQSLLSNKLETKKDITSVTAVPIVGEIGRSPESNNLIVKEKPRHPVSEQFRLLRTNLEYMLPAHVGSRVIMLTSSMSGEGKSFLSLNLAAMMSLGEKKVVLLEFDLRKPKLSKYINFENNYGLSSFLINKSSDINTLIKRVPGIENLYLFGSGPIPPNPAELINSDRTVELFSQLKANFDYIIIDVPPVGLVTDALLLSTYADISLFVVRYNYTFKNQLELVDELYQSKKLTNLGLVVNDIKKQKGYEYGYGYGISYGYGYGNTEE